MPPSLGQVPDVVATYAGFIDFLVQGCVVPRARGAEEKGLKRGDDLRHFITRNERMLKILSLSPRGAGALGFLGSSHERRVREKASWRRRFTT